MRNLFVSERRYIRSVLRPHLAGEGDFDLRVVGEYYAPPRVAMPGPRFNLDFVLRFVEKDAIIDHNSYCARVLPGTLGAEVFVTVDAHTGQPLMTELDSGEAFGLKDLRRYVDQVEAELDRLEGSLRLRDCEYCRMFVIEGEICFLCFLEQPEPALRGRRDALRDDGAAALVCYREDGRVLGVDGWLKTEVPETDRYVVAVKE
jgi:hypothetical protein